MLSKDRFMSLFVNFAIFTSSLVIAYSLINIEDHKSSHKAGTQILSGESSSATFVSTPSTNSQQAPIEGFLEGFETLESGAVLLNGWFKNESVEKIGIQGSSNFKAPAVFIERSDLGDARMGFQVFLDENVLEELLLPDKKICLLGLGANQMWAPIQTLSGETCLEIRY